VNAGSRTGSKSSGFTLLELLVVLLIASLVVGLIPPLFSAAVPGARLKGAARDLAITLRETRNQAIIRNREMDVVLNLETAQYSTEGRTETLPGDVTLTVKPAAAESGLSFPEQRRVRFYPDGSATSTRITLAREGQGYELAVDWLIGRVRIAEATLDAP
jgi:general secretion pathway protein H